MGDEEAGSSPEGGGALPRDAGQPMPYVQVNQPIAVRASNGLGTAGGVLGIVGAVLFWIPGLNLMMALLSLIFGLVGLSRGRREGLPIGMAVTGVVLGTLGLVSIIGLFVLVGLFSASV